MFKYIYIYSRSHDEGCGILLLFILFIKSVQTASGYSDLFCLILV